MKRKFSLFVATRELISSPPVALLLRIHDGHLVFGEINRVSFVLSNQTVLSEDISIEYDPLTIDIMQADVMGVGTRTVVSLAILPRDLGTASIVFSTALPVETIQNTAVSAAYPYQRSIK